MNDNKNHICPVERAGGLDNRIRRWLQNPQKILKPYIKEGMTVLDIGCGPGFFSIPMAQMVGDTGKVIASDLQEGMLQKVKDKIKSTDLEKRITLHQCEANNIGISDPVDFVLLFYMVHEVPDKENLFKEILSILKPDGKVLIVEPPIHVSKEAFKETIKIAKNSGFIEAEGPKVRFSKTIIIKVRK